MKKILSAILRTARQLGGGGQKILAAGKNFWRSVGGRQKIFILAGGGLLLTASLLALILGTSLWQRLPKNWRAEIALNKLGVSAYQDPICHEDCFYERQTYEKIIVADLNRTKLALKIQAIILNEKENLNFREELIKTLKMFKTAPPDYLNDYLKKSDGNLKIKETIMNNFPTHDSEVLDDLLNRVRDLNQGEVERLEALIALENFGDDSLADFYLNLLENDPSLKIKDQALTALSNLGDAQTYFTPALLSQLEKILLAPTTNLYIRKSLVLFLADFLPEQEAATVKILVNVYNDQNFDKFTRTYAADILNRETANNYPLPTISDGEWEDYWSRDIGAQAFSN